MTKYFFLLNLLFIGFISFAQQASGDLVKELNKNISLYSADNASPLTLLEKIGVLEQKTNESSAQRTKLDDIGSIIVEHSAGNFIVNLTCVGETRCINVVKNDSIITSMPSNAFFFTEAKGANAFAKSLEQLVAKYSTENGIVKVKLLADNTSKDLQTEKEKPVVKAKATKVQDEEDDEDDKGAVKTKREATEKQTVVKKTRVTKEKSEGISDDEDAAEGKPQTNRRQREPMMDKEESSEPALDPVCKQLLAIIKAGKNSKFKEIEGSETNSEKKINESKIKLKGAKRNYLSWYKKERSFMAEFKTSNDREIILEEFLKLQTTLEDCLEGTWEDSDRSGDEIYANMNEEVKDVEYSCTADPQAPHMRIMIHTEGDKHTLFIRIQ